MLVSCFVFFVVSVLTSVTVSTILPISTVCVRDPLLPDCVQVFPPNPILPSAVPAVFGLSFHLKVIVALPAPTILVPSPLNLTLPESIMKDALASVPCPSFKSSLLPPSLTLMGLFAACNPAKLRDTVLLVLVT